MKNISLKIEKDGWRNCCYCYRRNYHSSNHYYINVDLYFTDYFRATFSYYNKYLDGKRLFICHSLFFFLDRLLHIIFIKSAIFCSLLPYFETMFNCLIIYALAMITINRFFTVIKRFFKRQICSFISSAIQWLIAIILPLPNFAFLPQVSIRCEIVINQ
jgi:hypothetical protein